MAYQTTFDDPLNSNIPDVVVDSVCENIVSEDHSDYAGNGESGHALADFTDYRKVTITRPDASTYVFSSLGDGDELINAAQGGNNEFSYTFLTTDADGVWAVKLCSVPTYNAGATYQKDDDIVYYSGIFYESLVDANTGNQPDTSPTKWGVILESALSDKYCVTYKIGVNCIALLKCYEDLNYEANCEIQTNFCDSEVLAKNKKFLDAMTLRLLLDGADFAVARSQFEEAENIYNLAKTICNCR